MGLFFKSKNKTGAMPRPVQEDLGVSGNAYGIDLGTSNIKIFNSQTGKIKVAKNMIAIQNRKLLFAYGDAAYEMYEKAPASIKVSRPINYGVIADINNMEQLLQSFLRDEQRGVLRPADFFIAVPTDVTEVERRAFYDLVRDAGVKARRVMGVEKAIADGLGLGIDVKNSQGCMIVDIGFDTTEISILSLGGIVLSKLLKTGGHVFDQAIVTAVRREYNLVIGMKTAEAVRLSSHSQGGRGTTVVYGRDIVTGLPVERILSSEFVEKSLEEHFSGIADQVHVILERTPPELSADIYRHGLFITGGACQEEGLAQKLQEECRLDVNMADAPVNTVAIGLSQVIRKKQYRNLAYTIEGLAE
ncbi:rod shape-determining protein MreB [Lachnospiraceae bacterium NK3A20]|nr:rod shape-determining protein MreB [Lachnospiraceae bacterium NK3A20]